MCAVHANKKNGALKGISRPFHRHIIITMVVLFAASHVISLASLPSTSPSLESLSALHLRVAAAFWDVSATRWHPQLRSI